MFVYIMRAHLGRAIAAVTMVETIFLLTVFAEMVVSAGGGPGYSPANLSYLIYRYALLETDIRATSVGGVVAILTRQPRRPLPDAFDRQKSQYLVRA